MSMYKNMLVACIKATGKVLHDKNEIVKLPFGTEFSIFLKNLNSVRASVSINIDGNDVLDGVNLIIQPNSELNLERFIKNGNFNSGNKFKFIERNSKVEQARGVKAEDGLVRIEFKFEKIIPKPVYPVYTQCWNGWPYIADNNVYYKSTSYGSHTKLMSSNSSFSEPVMSAARGISPGSTDKVHCNYSASINDAGITAPGSVSDQKFVTAAWFPVEDEKHVIILKLLGETEQGVQIMKPITVKTKQKCVTCNHVNKASAKFCSECGTGLILI